MAIGLDSDIWFCGDVSLQELIPQCRRQICGAAVCYKESSQPHEDLKCTQCENKSVRNDADTHESNTDSGAAACESPVLAEGGSEVHVRVANGRISLSARDAYVLTDDLNDCPDCGSILIVSVVDLATNILYPIIFDFDIDEGGNYTYYLGVGWDSFAENNNLCDDDLLGLCRVETHFCIVGDGVVFAVDGIICARRILL